MYRKTCTGSGREGKCGMHQGGKFHPGKGAKDKNGKLKAWCRTSNYVPCMQPVARGSKQLEVRNPWVHSKEARKAKHWTTMDGKKPKGQELQWRYLKPGAEMPCLSNTEIVILIVYLRGCAWTPSTANVSFLSYGRTSHLKCYYTYIVIVMLSRCGDAMLVKHEIVILIVYLRGCAWTPSTANVSFLSYGRTSHLKCYYTHIVMVMLSRCGDAMLVKHGDSYSYSLPERLRVDSFDRERLILILRTNIASEVLLYSYSYGYVIQVRRCHACQRWRSRQGRTPDRSSLVQSPNDARIARLWSGRRRNYSSALETCTWGRDQCAARVQIHTARTTAGRENGAASHWVEWNTRTASKRLIAAEVPRAFEW